MTKLAVDLNSPSVQQIIREHGAILTKAMDGMAAACQIAGISNEDRAALIIRMAASFAYGVCKTYNFSPEEFAKLIHLFTDIRITIPRNLKVN